MDTTIFNCEDFYHILQSNEVKELKLFGSCIRNEETEDSDIDLLVSFKKKVGLLTLIRLERELSYFFGRKIDLLTEKSLNNLLKNQILSEAQVIYHDKG